MHSRQYVAQGATGCSAKGKTIANFSSIFKEFGLYERLQRLPEDRRGLGEWTELPDHLR